MDRYEKLRQELAADDAQRRNAAALAIMDSGDARLVDDLIRAIENPAHRRARGTLIYALSAFPCTGRYTQLFRWAIEGGFEASSEAMSIIHDQQLAPDEHQYRECQELLQAALRDVAFDPELGAELGELLEIAGADLQ